MGDRHQLLDREVARNDRSSKIVIDDITITSLNTERLSVIVGYELDRGLWFPGMKFSNHESMCLNTSGLVHGHYRARLESVPYGIGHYLELITLHGATRPLITKALYVRGIS